MQRKRNNLDLVDNFLQENAKKKKHKNNALRFLMNKKIPTLLPFLPSIAWFR